MFNRHLRLRHRQDFARLRREGKTLRHPYFMLSYAPNALAHNRYGFITSKHLGKAVARNRVRRLLREVIRHNHSFIYSGYDIVIIARSKIMEQPFDSIERNVCEQLKRAKLLIEENYP